MGAEPYCYFTTYNQDIQKALDDLREAELRAGRYEPCFKHKTGKYLFEFELAPRHTFPSPGGCHSSIDEVFENVDESGSFSILDVFRIVDRPFSNVSDPMIAEDIMERFNTSSPLADEELVKMFGSTRPNAKQIEITILETGQGDGIDLNLNQARDRFWTQMGRGHSRYIVAYSEDVPDQIFFAGLSFD